MSKLSTPLSNIRSCYDVIVVGSGYGGGVASSRLARMGKQVCVLERGKEFQPGEYPDTSVEAAKQFQVDLPAKHLGSKTALFDARVNDDINVVVGCGLGGTSLINANVSIMAEPRVFEDQCWPEQIRQEAQSISSEVLNPTHCEDTVEHLSHTNTPDNTLELGYRRAIAMLKPVPYPENAEPLPKLQAHQHSAAYLGETFCRTPINVTFKDGVNHVGIHQTACNLCGDCVSGCNVGAKNTTLMNYLPDARNHGAEIFTEVAVTRIAKAGNRWRVYYQPVSLERENFDAPEMFVIADTVILSAGTMGSNEILLRSKQNGLELSEQLGKSFTGNGDVLAFGFNNDVTINGLGFGDKALGEIPPVGPCITGVIDARGKPNLTDDMVIEEGSLPGALSSLLPAAFLAADKIIGEDTDRGLIDTLKEKLRVFDTVIRGPYKGAMNNTQTYLVMAHDGSNGEMVLENDRLRVHWQDIGEKPIFKDIEKKLIKCVESLGGAYIPNPTWNELLDHQLITVHPLGGCAMADSAEQGVVNHKCQVFSGYGNSVHNGLYVCDGSIIPRSLGTNPLLTISALSERACKLIAEDQQLNDGYTETSEAPPTKPEPKLGIQFTEKMSGFFSNKETNDYDNGAGIGKAENTPFSFILTVISDDLDTLIDSEQHSAGMIGSVEAPSLSDKPLTVTEGRFNLFVKDQDEVGVRRMLYRLKMTDENGRDWFMHGFKRIHDDKGFDIWDDTTTLYITVYDGPDENTPVYGKGVLKILAEDFARQMTTIRARNTASTGEAVKATARFGRFFAGVVYDNYSGPFAPLQLHNPDAPPRTKRALRVGAAVEYQVKTEDNVQIRLTRYQGGNKGPVILSHGLGVSSKIFSLDTIDTNLLEYLYAHEYDVWLLDYRASIELPASKSQFSADEIAKYDYPAAVEKVRQETGAESVQMVAHCFGSTTFFMSMLSGLQGVRSAVASQIAMHLQPPLLTRLKCGLYLPSILDELGVDSLTAYVDSNANWTERLYDNALRFYPIEFEEQSNNPVDRRITFMYGQLWELDQLNPATHENLHELFGIANITSFEHLAMMVRHGHLVDINGADIYMDNISKLAIPITFIHGEENAAFTPKSTELSFNLLRKTNGELYERYVIPNYGHIDCIFGKNAVKDVYPYILDHLERT